LLVLLRKKLIQAVVIVESAPSGRWVLNCINGDMYVCVCVCFVFVVWGGVGVSCGVYNNTTIHTQRPEGPELASFSKVLYLVSFTQNICMYIYNMYVYVVYVCGSTITTAWDMNLKSTLQSEFYTENLPGH
jgi:hypothetical protein